MTTTGVTRPSLARDLAISLDRDRPGTLARAAEAIAAGGFNLEGFAEVEGTLRVLTSDPGGARRALEFAGLRVVAEQDVVVARLDDRPGVAAALFRLLAGAGLDVSSAYIASGNRVVIADGDPERTLALLRG